MSELIIFAVPSGYFRQGVVWCLAAKVVEKNAQDPGRFLLWQHKSQRTADGIQLRVETGGRSITRFENQLTGQLDEAGQTILAKLIESQHEIDDITALENFILGFRLGVRMMAKCMDDHDGGIRDVTDRG